jgi:CHAT domain-containing protein
MTYQISHLTGDQIRRYLRQEPDKTLDKEQEQLDSHLSKCSHCLQLALQAQRAQLGFLEFGPVSTTAYPGCPNEELVIDLAAGNAQENVGEIIRHVVRCDFCGPLLASCKVAFSQNFTAEEESFLEGLGTSQKEWQANFIDKLLHSEPDPAKGSGWIGQFFSAIRLALSSRTLRWTVPAMTAITLGIGISVEGPVLWGDFLLAKAEKLAIQAASQQSTIEMRIPGADYAHYHKEMGAEVAVTSPSLREAQSLVLEKKSNGPLESKWLQAEGLTSLLDGTTGGPSKAVISFEKALADGVDDPALEIELAASYFESDKPNVPKAIELLEGVLARPKLSNEDRKVALYDLGIAYENIKDWRDAASKWEAYLALDSSSDWAKEAKTALDKARSMMKSEESTQPDPSPTSFLEQPGLQSRVEEYQEIALDLWLPQAIQKPQSDGGRASRTLAKLLLANHSDPFLDELLKNASPDQAVAFELLKRASQQNRTGPYGKAGQDARKAASMFALHHNPQGELYAEFEEVFAAQQGIDSSHCAALTLKLKKKLASTKYRWLMAQTALERATCLNQSLDYNAARSELEASEKIENNNFPILSLRILGLRAGILRLQNFDDESWRQGVEGLRRFAEGRYPWQRLYQFYSVLEQYAEKKHFLHTQRALLSQAIALQETAPPADESVLVKGTLYGRLSTVCLALKEDSLAKEASAKANLFLVQGASGDPSADRYIVYTRTGLAEAQLHLGNPEMAVFTLEPGMGLIAHLPDKLIALDFYRTLGDSYRRVYRLDESVAIYEAGIVIAEQVFSSINDESLRLKWVNGVDPVYRGLVLDLLQQGKDEDALQLWEWYGGRSAQSQDRLNDGSQDGLKKKISAPLLFPDSQTRLIYAAFEDRLQIWTVHERRIRSRSIKIKQSDLERKVSDFSLECATYPRFTYSVDRLRKTGEPLFSLFLQPVQAELPASHRVIVELDPRLARLPIAALMAPDGRYFGDDYAITISPGSFRENNLRVTHLVGPELSILLATGAPSHGGDRLKRPEELERAVRRAFAGVKFSNAEQNSWAEVSGNLKNSEGFIFLGHGVLDGPSTALKYGNVLLNAKSFPPDILQRLRFAVLAACSSGAGGENAWQDTNTFLHAFLAGGVPSIIVSRWNVDSESTSALLESFFIHLSKGEDMALALCHARSEFRQLLLHPDQYRHPYFWAGLQLVGRADSIPAN